MHKVVVGLSGGVDSAVTAAILKEAGYEVHGLFLDFGLTSPDDARKVADDLGIYFHVKYLKDALEANVCAYFINEYKNARTPNPCIVCNPTVKFKALIALADKIGAEKIATGHYARTGMDSRGRPLLLKADSPKDQSYMLCRLPREYVGRILFPLGAFKNKDEVRAKAREFGIFIASKPDSMEICFVPDGDYTDFMEKRGITMPEGDFVDENGKILGRHSGLQHYTVGQRKGLGIAAEGRLFVHKLDIPKNQVVLSLNDVYSSEIKIHSVNYIAPEYAEGGKPFEADVKVRYSKGANRAVIYPDGDSARITFDPPVRAPASGQSAVFYDGDILIGGGFIE